MKFLLPILLVIAASCGKISGIEGSGAVGTVRTLQVNTISGSDALVFDRICQALTRKGAKLESALPNSLSFSVVENDCNKNLVDSSTQAVRVEKAGTGEFQFRRQDTNALFVFPKVETSSFGFMKELCGGASQMPVVKNDSAVWVSSSVSESDCPSKSNEVCLSVEYGSKEPNTQNGYRIHTRELVRFNVQLNAGNYGYFTYRRAYASNNCDLGKFTETQATLR